MKLVVIESPYAGDVESNIIYAQKCMRDCIINYNENPYASHLIFTQPGILDDLNPEERELGIKLGFAWEKFAEKTVVYCDLGISVGMNFGILEAIKQNRPIEIRYLFPENIGKYDKEVHDLISKG